ncbi:hypothetical protein OS493_033398 [Desmophyllum pertusum]|uniref:Uncharacterized protein n=1 Tax=Desmophyllum pertusum TaxID=174260 RepID=A0A9W9YJ55_9CNID|nr:hypothetical protein OS493_033398 [Desmophyllum pertusum]
MVFGEEVITSGWSGNRVPVDSFYTVGSSYMWIRFTTNGGNEDGRFHQGWSGPYKKYWPYGANGKKKRSLRKASAWMK